jgi:hypothetical protein
VSLCTKSALRSALFYDITQRRVVITYRRFGTTYRAYLQGSTDLDSLPLKMGLIGCPETSVSNYHYTLLISPKFCRRNKEFGTEVMKPAFLLSSFIVTVKLYFDLLVFFTSFCFIFAKNVLPNYKKNLWYMTSEFRISIMFATPHLETVCLT